MDDLKDVDGKVCNISIITDYGEVSFNAIVTFYRENNALVFENTDDNDPKSLYARVDLNRCHVSLADPPPWQNDFRYYVTIKSRNASCSSPPPLPNNQAKIDAFRDRPL